MSDETAVADRLLDAAVEVATIHGLARLSVGDVAKRAGLSRQTLYKHFSSRDALIAAAVVREATTLTTQIIAAAAPLDDPADALRAAIVATLRLTREHPLLDRLVRTEPETLLPFVVGDTGPVAGTVRAVVEQIIDQKTPGLSPVELRRVADLVTRLLISYAVSAPDDPPEVVADVLADVLTAGLNSRTTAS
jgi:AcrR family transcriptional regulator